LQQLFFYPWNQTGHQGDWIIPGAALQQVAFFNSPEKTVPPFADNYPPLAHNQFIVIQSFS
jgi:hypothetical protein